MPFDCSLPPAPAFPPPAPRRRDPLGRFPIWLPPPRGLRQRLAAIGLPISVPTGRQVVVLVLCVVVAGIGIYAGHV